MHERTTWPLRCTEQAPHWATPQPYLVPVRPTCSRSTHSRGVLGSTSTWVDFPLRVKRAIACSPLSVVCCGNCSLRAAQKVNLLRCKQSCFAHHFVTQRPDRFVYDFHEIARLKRRHRRPVAAEPDYVTRMQGQVTRHRRDVVGDAEDHVFGLI